MPTENKTANGPVHLTPTRRHAGCLVASLPASVAPTVRGRWLGTLAINMARLRYFILLLLLLVLGGCGKSDHPKDDALISNFKRNELDFDRMVTMLREDKELERVDDTWTKPDDPASIGVTKERIDSYRALFSKLGIPRGFYAFHDPERFTLLASVHGLSISGSAKGYAYLVQKPDLVVGSLDEYWSPDGKSFTAYRHIKGNWYLYFDYED